MLKLESRHHEEGLGLTLCIGEKFVDLLDDCCLWKGLETLVESGNGIGGSGQSSANAVARFEIFVGNHSRAALVAAGSVGGEDPDGVLMTWGDKAVAVEFHMDALKF